MLAPNTLPEEKNEILRLGLRQLLGLFPVAGPILNDILFNFRNNVKQERLNHFVSLLEAAFVKYDIQVEKLKTEGALDLLEQVLSKVAGTRCANKRAAFKNILVRGINHPSQVQECEVFNEILGELKDVQLRILAEHKNYLSEGKPLMERLHALNKQYRSDPSGQHFIYTDVEVQIKREMLSHNLSEVKQMLEEYQTRCNASLFDLETDQYHFFLRGLIAKGLLVDQGIGTYDPTPLKYMGITEFGQRFLEFILEE